MSVTRDKSTPRLCTYDTAQTRLCGAGQSSFNGTIRPIIEEPTEAPAGAVCGYWGIHDERCLWPGVKKCTYPNCKKFYRRGTCKP
jgi:hypothetical protein